ncbi:hypothetical protein AYI69_g6208 [Smittium culicis]|uniref:Uncharacterized protein n=1 Tax=Smittium culicis TaxID=133412 RepID=A0A1R1Y0I0_9FUNG|nr:hypothetical protein AYI69_g6208 [Smittium culicis]
MKNASVDDTTSKIISECTPKEITGPDGTSYIEKIPNHYVMYIPNRYSKEMVVERLDLRNAAKTKPGALGGSKNPPAKRAKTKKHVSPATLDKRKASPQPTGIKPGSRPYCLQTIDSADFRSAAPSSPVPAAINAQPAATANQRAASPANCDLNAHGTYTASFQNSAAPFAKHMSYDQLLINYKDGKNNNININSNNSCSSSNFAHMFNLNFLHPQPLQQSTQLQQQQQQQQRTNNTMQQIPNTNIMQQLQNSNIVAQNHNNCIPQQAQYQLQIPKSKDSQQQQYLQQLQQQALYLYSSM